MLVPGDLGFLNPVLLFVFAFCPIVGFVIRWKWRAAVARKQEIMRLVVLASEEAARAELEATVEYGTTSVANQFQCAVCYCPTTTRCSRCKAVRYCSGKCQIIHWRQGHKEECRPPSTSIQVNDEESECARTVLVQEQPEIQGNSSETHEKWNAKLVESEESAPSKFSCSPESPYGKGDDNTVEHLDIKRTKNISGSSISPELVTCSKPSILNVSLVDSCVSVFSAPIKEPLADACISELPSSTTADRSEASLCNEIADDMHDSTNVESTETFKGSPSDFSSLSASVNGSCSSKLKIMENSCNDGEINCKSVCSSSSSINSSDESSTTETSGTPDDLCKGSVDSNESRTDVHVDHACSSFNEAGNGSFCDPGSILKFSFNLSASTIPTLNSQLSEPKNVVSDDSQPAIVESKKPAVGAARFGDVVPEASKVKSSPLGSERKDSVAECVTSGLPVLMSTGIRSVSSSVCDDSSYSKARVHSVPTIKPGQSEVTGAMQHASNGLKTSVRKVVHQFRASKLSKHYPFGFGDISRRYDYKMLFPYDLFVKLYNWNKSELRPCGLTNCGNSCYANAVLQCLAFTRPLAAYLLQGLHSKSCSKKEWCFLCEFESLIMKAMEGKSPLSPIGILSQIQNIGSNLGHGKEEDAHEFLRYAVDTMQSVFLKETGTNEVDPLADQTTLIGLIFGGYLRSKIKCMKCHGKSERHERMMDLTVEIHGDIGTLEEALAQFTATEILDGENKYQCSRCKSYEKAKKKLTILEAPNVLTIALKRFQSGKFGKINKSVRFPETLDLAPYMSGTRDKSPVYRLYAVVVHLDIMNAAFSGHYVCYVKNNRDRWFKIDDSTVKPVDLDRVLSKGAYMLLYARCSPRAPSLVRDMLMSYGGKISRRYLESVCSGYVGKGSMPKERFNPAMPTDPSMARQRPEDYPHWLNLGGVAGSGSFDFDDGRFRAIHRLHMDSSSDNSSLFSFSDEGSCSTESTRDSTSTEDLSDYIFGEVGRSWNSPWRNLSDSDASSSPMFSRHSPNAAFDRHAQTSGHQGTCTVDATTEAYELQSRQFQGSICKEDMEGATFLYPDTSKQRRKLANSCRGSSSSSSSSSCSSCRSSSCREADSEWQGWVNPFNMKSVVSFRKSSREKQLKHFIEWFEL